MQEKIIAIIVTYNGDWARVAALVESLTLDDCSHVIVDNGSDEIPAGTALNIVRLGRNVGIAAAQNVGIRYAKDAGADVVVFFDQDSTIGPNFVRTLIAPLTNGQASIAAPMFYDFATNFAHPIVKISRYGFRRKYYPEQIDDFFYTNAVISSGTASRVNVFDAAGLMDESLFIDYVDTEWTLRCASHGYLVKINRAAIMRHSIGNKTIRLGLFNVPVHSASRRYYRIRNSFLLLRATNVPKFLAVREISFSLIHQFILICTQPNRIAYLRYAWLAILDGVLGRNGAFDKLHQAYD